MCLASGVPDSHHAVACLAHAGTARAGPFLRGTQSPLNSGGCRISAKRAQRGPWENRVDHEGASPHTQTPSPLGFALLAQTNQTKPVRRAVSHLYPLILFLLREYFRPRSRIYPCLMSNLLYSRRVVFLHLDPPPTMCPPHPLVASQSTLARCRVKEEDLRKK